MPFLLLAIALFSLLASGQTSNVRISAIVNTAGETGRLAPNSWMTIYGIGLSSTTASWSTFPAGALPTSLNGVSVLVNGKPAYVSYISPGQINFLTPADTATGPISITTLNQTFASTAQLINRQPIAPAFFPLATSPNGSIVKSVKPGDIVTLWMTGLGPTSPAYPEGKLITTSAKIISPISLTIAGLPAPIDYAGLVAPGVYQLNIRIPNAPNGEAPLVIKVASITTQSTQYLTIKR